MQIYITTYALSKGILALDPNLSEKAHTFDYMLPGSEKIIFCVRGYDWHTSIVAAMSHADKLRDEQISKYQKEIDRLSRKLLEVGDIEREEKMADTIVVLKKRIENLREKKFSVREQYANDRGGYARVRNVRELCKR